jgi:hypothetical protein
MQHLAHLQQLGLRFLAMNDKGFIGFAAQEHGEGIDSQAAKLMKPGSELNRNESLVL